MTYEEFIKSKEFKISNISIETNRDELNENLFEYQKDLVYLALKKGKFALFSMTGTGKTPMQGEWCYHVSKYTNKPTLILAPLSVVKQTINEIKNILGYDVTLCECQEDIRAGINITNYDKLHKFDCSVFGGVALDESSILKAFTGKIRNQIVESFYNTKFKLCCTATPAPNDFVELGNHVEFLNVCRSKEMLSMFFINDVLGDEGKWRLKKHAEDKFWEWVAKFAVVFTKPSDIGYDENEDNKFKLPNKYTFEHIVKSEASDGLLFCIDATDLNSRRKARRDSLEDRCKVVADLVNSSDKVWLVWCDLNDESDMLKKLINDSVEVRGSDTDKHKVEIAINFQEGKIKCLIAKPQMFGMGMNFQICNNMAFTGLSDSFEQVFQAERRCYRFGQKNDVNVHIVISEAEGNVKKNQLRKEKQFLKMIDSLVVHTKNCTLKELKSINIDNEEYNPQIEMKLPNFLKGE